MNKFIEALSEYISDLIIDNERWITIHPHGDDSEDYRRLKLEDGESPKEAIERVYKKDPKGGKEEKKEDKKGKEQKAPSPKAPSKYFENFRKLSEKAEKLKDEWYKKGDLLTEEIKKNKEYQELEEKYKKITDELMNTNYYQEREKYADLQKQRNEVSNRQSELRKNLNEKIGVFKAQSKYSDAESLVAEERKKLIIAGKVEIQDQIKKISSKHDKLVENLNSLENEPYIQKNNELKAQRDKLRDIRSKMANYSYYSEEYKALQKEEESTLNSYWAIRNQRSGLSEDFAKKITKLLQVEDGIEFDLDPENKAMEVNASKIKELMNGIAPNSRIASQRIKVHQTYNVRASQSGHSVNLHNDENVGSIVHEVAHQLEEDNPHMLINSLSFASARTGDEKQKALKKFSSSYKKDEYCKPDKFFDPYCGKLYTLYGGKDRQFLHATASEIMSMGVQRVFEDPISFAKEDREYFDFVIANLRGELWD